MPDPIEREHDGEQTYDDICPHCGGQGFDGQGYFDVGNVQMYRKRCWNCGVTFAVETPEHRDDADADADADADVGWRLMPDPYPHGKPYNPDAAPVYHTSADLVRHAIREHRDDFRVPVAMPYLHDDDRRYTRSGVR